jgi:exopolysaccharide biosynthesis polyprenyl glycosylphosphotransferase
MLGSGRKEQFSLQVFQLIDAAIVYLSFVVASWFRGIFKNANADGYGLDAVLWMVYLLVPAVPLLLEMFGFYDNLLRKRVSGGLIRLLQTFVLIGTALSIALIVFKQPFGSRWIIVIGLALVFLGISLRFIIARFYLRKRVKDGPKKERVIIVGTGKDTAAFVASIPSSVSDYWEVRGEFDLKNGTVDELEVLLKDESIQRAIFAAQYALVVQLSEAVEICEAQGVEIWISASFIRSQISRPVFDTLGGKPMLVLKSTPELSWYLLGKSLMDRVGALVMIIVSFPFWIIAYIGIKIASPGPVFFKQDRAGKYGKSFVMWKFRTMVMGAEAKLAEVKAQQGNEMDGPVFKLNDDPRVFKFARLLRKLSIDELPQLINVLLGDMSLVGPRPLPVYEVEEFSKSTYRRRMSVKPGITCTWQVSGRNSITNFDDWIELDLEYIDNWSLWYDIKILLKTIPAVLFGAGAK